MSDETTGLMAKEKGAGGWRAFYVVALPIIWVASTVVSYHHPGDEYGMFAFSAIVGAWVFFFLPKIASFALMLLIILLVGRRHFRPIRPRDG